MLIKSWVEFTLYAADHSRQLNDTNVFGEEMELLFTQLIENFFA